MSTSLAEHAKEIIEKILYITVASVSKDGVPWNSPVYSSHDEEYNFFWASPYQSQHSRNIKENDQVFIVIYDSTAAEGTGEGVYIQAKAYELSDEKEITHALKYHYGRKNKEPRPASDFLGSQPLREYKAVPGKIWTNIYEKIEGRYVDGRIEISLK